MEKSWLGRVFEAKCERCGAVRRTVVERVEYQTIAGKPHRVLYGFCPLCGAPVVVAYIPVKD